MDCGHPSLDHHCLVLSNGRQSRGRLVVLSCPRLGWLLGVGSRGKCCLHALATGYCLSPFGTGPRTPADAQSVEPLVDYHRLQFDDLRNFSHTVWNSIFDTRLLLWACRKCLSCFSFVRSARISSKDNPNSIRW